MSLGKRLKEARQFAGLTQSSLAQKSGVKQQSISKIESEKQDSTTSITELSEACGVDPVWLSTGRGQMQKGGSNVEPASIATGRKVPLISEVQAGNWVEQYDHFAPGDAEDWIEAGSNVGGRAFALRVSGDSMTSPSPPSIPHGAIIIVDPDMQAENGSLVVAKLTDTQGTTFKKLVIDGPNKYLKPLNPDYRPIPINGNCIIVGVVKSALMQF